MPHDIDRTLAVLAHPIRRKIVEILAERSHSFPTRHIFPHFGVSESAVSQHLKLMVKAGLIHCTCAGKSTRYVLDQSVLAVMAAWANRIQVQATENRHPQAQIALETAKRLHKIGASR